MRITMGQVALERMDRWEQNIPIRRRQNTTRRRVSFWNSHRLVKQIRFFFSKVPLKTYADLFLTSTQQTIFIFC